MGHWADGPPTYTLELGERTLALGAAMPYYEINGATNCGHKVYGDWQQGLRCTTCERMILCEDVGDCVASGIWQLNCAEKAAVTAECEKDYIEFRAPPPIASATRGARRPKRKRKRSGPQLWRRDLCVAQRVPARVRAVAPVSRQLPHD